jgi:hypothetical protein
MLVILPLPVYPKGEKLYAPEKEYWLGSSTTQHAEEKMIKNALSIWRGISQHADYDANQGEVRTLST